MSKGGGSKNVTNTTVQNNDPWSAAQPYLRGGLQDLSSWYQSDAGRNPYPGSTVVPFNPMTEQAYGMVANRAVNGSPIMDSMNNTLQKTLDGDYLKPESNPWLADTFNMGAGQVRSALDSQFNSGNGYGSSLHSGQMASQLGDLATKIYGGNYQSERDRQMQGMLFAPQAAQTDYTDAAQLANVGAAYEKQAGATLQDSINRYNFGQEAPLKRLQDYFGLINPVAGQGGTSNSTQSQPSNSNSTSETIGTIASLAASAAAIFSDPDLKENIEPLDDNLLLEMFKDTPGFKYDYKGYTGLGRDKLGPMADRFAKNFGGDGRTIAMPKMLGAIWSAIPALTRKIEQLEARAS